MVRKSIGLPIPLRRRPRTDKMKIAILGGGISGLTVACRLQARHDITLFEANDYVGGHTHTVDVETGLGSVPIDTGFIVFNDRTYPQFSRLLQDLSVGTIPTEMGFSVRCDRTGIEYAGTDLAGLFAQRSNLFRPRFHRMLWDILRFNRQMSAEVDELDEKLTVGEYLRERQCGPMFVRHHFLPMASAVWSCPCGKIENFPIKFIGQFYKNHGLLSLTDRPQWYVIRGGSRTYVQAMMRGFEGQVHLKCPVKSLRRTTDGIDLITDQFGAQRFDHLVMACHSDQALQVLGSEASATERVLLSQFPYERNLAVLHTDVSLLPRRRRAWASWNYLLRNAPGEAAGPKRSALDAKVTVTYNMNILQRLQSDQTYCVSLNCDADICPDRVLRKITYHHPIFSTGRGEAQRRHPELLNHRRTSYCGAYWGNGFHEDGVVSGLKVCEAISRIDDEARLQPQQTAANMARSDGSTRLTGDSEFGRSV